MYVLKFGLGFCSFPFQHAVVDFIRHLVVVLELPDPAMSSVMGEVVPKANGSVVAAAGGGDFGAVFRQQTLGTSLTGLGWLSSIEDFPSLPEASSRLHSDAASSGSVSREDVPTLACLGGGGRDVTSINYTGPSRWTRTLNFSSTAAVGLRQGEDLISGGAARQDALNGRSVCRVVLGPLARKPMQEDTLAVRSLDLGRHSTN